MILSCTCAEYGLTRGGRVPRQGHANGGVFMSVSAVIRTWSLGLTLLLASVAQEVNGQSPAAPAVSAAQQAPQPVARAGSQIMWHSDVRQALGAAARSGKKIMVFFFAPEAAMSRSMEQQIFADPTVTALVQSGFEAAQINIMERPDDARTLGVMRAGTVVLYGSKGEGLGQITMPITPEEFVAKATQFAKVTPSAVSPARIPWGTPGRPTLEGSSWEFQRMGYQAPMGTRTWVQMMNQFEKPGTEWAHHNQLVVEGIQPGGSIDFEFDLPTQESGAVQIRTTKGPNYGTFRILLDGKVLMPEFNAYAPTVTPHLLKAGQGVVTAGRHKVTVQVIGKHTQSAGTAVGLDVLRLFKGGPSKGGPKAKKTATPKAG